jgi:predicted ATPase
VTNKHVITGAPGSGKTPILHELASLGFASVGEPAREVIAEQRATSGNAVYDTDPESFLKLMLSQAVADFERVSDVDGAVFFDRGIPDLVGYAELFGLDGSDAARAASEYRYDGPIFVLPSWREIYTIDGDRRMTFEAAEAFGGRVRDVYLELGYAVVDVPCDTVAARAKFIMSVVENRT